MGRLTKDFSQWGFFVSDLVALIESVEQVDAKLMGFPDNWESVLRNSTVNKS